MKLRKWELEEEETLKKAYLTGGAKLAKQKLPHRSLNAIYFRASQLGLRIRKFTGWKEWSEKEIKILRRYYPRFPNSKLLELLPDRNWSKIKNMLKKLGLRKGLACWAYNLEPLDSPEVEKSYLAGFLDGDGSIVVRMIRGRWQPELAFCNTNVKELEIIRHLLKPKVQTHLYIQRKGGSRKEIGLLKISSHADIYKLLKGIYPYLRIRRLNAELMLEFLMAKATLQNKKKIESIALSLRKVTHRG